MIVILCDDFYDAKEAFLVFWDYLEFQYSTRITHIWKNLNCLETDDDLRYIFIDYRYADCFKEITPDILDVDEFFEDLTYDL